MAPPFDFFPQKTNHCIDKAKNPGTQTCQQQNHTDARVTLVLRHHFRCGILIGETRFHDRKIKSCYHQDPPQYRYYLNYFFLHKNPLPAS